MISDPVILLKSAAKIYRQKFETIFQLGLIVLVIGIFQLASIEMRFAPLFVLSAIAGVVVSYIVYVAMIRAISNSKDAPLGALFAESQPYILPAVWVSALTVLAVSGGFLLFFVPGIAALVFLLFSLMSSVIDNHKKQEALFNSWMLVRGRWWQVFFRFVAANIVIGLAGTAIALIFWFAGIGENPFRMMESGTRAVSFGQSIVNQIISNFFIVPMSVAFTYVLYNELKAAPHQIASESDRAILMSRIHILVGAGVAFIIAGIFIFGFFMSRFLPNVVGATHSPAAVFEAF